MKQHLKALELANRVRSERGEIKRRVFAGELTVAEILADVPDEARGMRIATLLGAQRQWGDARVRWTLRELRISESRPLERLSLRERREIASAVGSELPGLRGVAA